MVGSRRGLLVAALVLIAALAASAETDASHSWNKYHWARATNPLSLQLGDNVSADWDANLAQTSSDWSLSAVLDTRIVAGSTTGATCAATQGTVQVCSSNYGSNGWLGLAQIWLTRGTHIAQGVAKMNDYYWTPEANYAYANEAEAEHVMCQEVGHAFGLGHTSEDGSSQNTCMDYYHNTSDTDLVSTTPNAHDYAQLASTYKHLDKFTTSAGSTPATAEWARGHAPDGTPFGASPDRGRWYVEDLGHGDLLFTHVNWK